MSKPIGFRFFAVPGHVAASDKPITAQDIVQPQIAAVPDAVGRALAGAQFRDVWAHDRLRTLLLANEPPPLPAPDNDSGRSAIFARPPQDLPALLRLADQLESLTQVGRGERAVVWKCDRCSTRYAVPLTLVRRVLIRCEKCGASVELSPERRVGEEALQDPFLGEINLVRLRLAEFFREAMARGLWVLVCAMSQRST
jgi:hypothetical protein